ncbi:MAG: amidase [Pseudomonadota bacterium]
MTSDASTPAGRVHAFGNDLLADHDAVALAALIRRREISPAEAARAAIARAAQVNPVLNAIELADFDAALRAADAPRSGVFAGVPTFVKDNTDLAGLPTRHGSRAVNPGKAKKHGAFAQQFLAQGFNVLGKSSLPEFGFNASTEFAGEHPTRNPWNPDYSSGASSGGSAALVAAGVVPVAHANDGGGSIRIPAACCGLVGLKPTRGRFIDSEQARSLPVNVIGEGVVSRSVRDQAEFFHGMERFWRNPRMPEIGRVEGPGRRKLRIGLVVDSITGTPTCDETRAVVDETARLLAGMGHRLEPMPLPVTASFIDDFTLYWGFLAFMVGITGRYTLSPDFDAEALDPFSRGLARFYRQRFWRTPQMLYRLRRSARQYAENIRGWDAVLSPVLAHSVPKLGFLSPEVPFDTLFERLQRYAAFTPLNNATGSPAISLPMGASANGLPIGIQLSAAHGDERTLLELAFALEQAKPFRKITG